MTPYQAAAASGVDTCWYDLVADGEFILGAVPGADGLYTGVGTVYDIGRFAPARFAAEGVAS